MNTEPSLPEKEYNKRYYALHKLKENVRCAVWYRHNKERKGQYQREYRLKKLEEKATSDKNFRERLKLEVFSHYANGRPVCAICGRDDLEMLVLDHIEGDGSAHRELHHYTLGTGTWLWAKRNKYPPIFQVLCYKCNQRKGNSDFNVKECEIYEG